jgi:hypothetical protein
MMDFTLDVDDQLARIGLIPAPIQVFCRKTELDNEIARQVLRFDLTALFAPKPDQGGFVVAHDDPGIRAANEGAPVYSVESRLWQTFLHGILNAILLYHQLCQWHM